MSTQNTTAPTSPEPKTPSWVDETPEEETDYQLEMFNESFAVQNVQLTRSEYIALKARLAALRGIVTGETEAEEQLQVAEGIGAARA